MAKHKASLSYTQLSCNIFSTDSFRRLIRRARRADYSEDKIANMKLVVLVVWLIINRSEHGYYIEYDEDLIGYVAEDSSLADTTVDDIIHFLVDNNYYCSVLFSNFRIITSVEIQDVYFQVMARLKRQPNYNTPYILINVEGDSSERKNNSSEKEGDSSEEKNNFYEERSNSSAERTISNSKRKETYMEWIYNSSSSEKTPYDYHENYYFYVIMMMENVQDPAKATNDFITYNQAQSWTSPKTGIKYGTPAARCALALQFAKNPKTQKGRLVGREGEIMEKQINETFLNCLFDLYRWADEAQYPDIPAYIILNANARVVLHPVDQKEYDLEFFVGRNAKIGLEEHLAEVRTIITSRFRGVRDVRFSECSSVLISMTP